jgi:hypothetical protein
MQPLNVSGSTPWRVALADVHWLGSTWDHALHAEFVAAAINTLLAFQPHVDNMAWPSAMDRYKLGVLVDQFNLELR